MAELLTWDATYAIAKELMRQHAQSDLEDVSIRQIYLWTIALPGFDDDPLLVNDGILEEIYRIWYEELTHDN
jgi:FeS assembly protein IscX